MNLGWSAIASKSSINQRTELYWFKQLWKCISCNRLTTKDIVEIFQSSDSNHASADDKNVIFDGDETYTCS